MIAMMLVSAPKIMIADEPTSALDVLVQAEILNLLTNLRAEHKLTYLMVSMASRRVGISAKILR